jgi:hypothetical protein
MGVKLVSSGGGSVEINPPATASNFVATMPAGTGTVAVQGVSSNIVSGTAVASTSGTSINFTGIPSWVKRITVMFSGVSTNGASNIQIQLGTSGGVENTGYTSATGLAGIGASGNATATSGVLATQSLDATLIIIGSVVITNVSSNTWVSSVATARSDGYGNCGGSTKTLSGTLDRVRITTVNGTDTFDAGSINILYE